MSHSYPRVNHPISYSWGQHHHSVIQECEPIVFRGRNGSQVPFTYLGSHINELIGLIKQGFPCVHKRHKKHKHSKTHAKHNRHEHHGYYEPWWNDSDCI